MTITAGLRNLVEKVPSKGVTSDLRAALEKESNGLLPRDLNQKHRSFPQVKFSEKTFQNPSPLGLNRQPQDTRRKLPVGDRSVA